MIYYTFNHVRKYTVKFFSLEDFQRLCQGQDISSWKFTDSQGLLNPAREIYNFMICERTLDEIQNLIDIERK